MKNFKVVVLVAFLAGITIFSALKYGSSVKERYDLRASLNQIKIEVANLENEKQGLSEALETEKQLQEALTQENAKIKEELKANQGQFSKINADFKQAQETIEQLNSQVAAFEIEKTGLKSQEDQMRLELAQVTQEKEELKARLSSVAELKKAIKELRHKVHHAEAVVVKQTAAVTKNIISGNRGFVIKDGRSTYPLRVRIEVEPVHE